MRVAAEQRRGACWRGWMGGAGKRADCSLFSCALMQRPGCAPSVGGSDRGDWFTHRHPAMSLSLSLCPRQFVRPLFSSSHAAAVWRAAKGPSALSAVPCCG